MPRIRGSFSAGEPEWNPRDLSDVKDPRELRLSLATAFDDYRTYLENSLEHLRRRPALGRPRLEVEETNIRIAQLQADIQFVGTSPLFTYSAPSRVQEQLENGLRVSAGADNDYLHQKGSFPRGPYGTTIEPWQREIPRGAMRLNFFDYEYAMPSVTQPISGTREFVGPIPERQRWTLGPRSELPTSHFIGFAQTQEWVPRGYLDYRETRQRYSERFLHYSMSEPTANYVAQPIVAHGVSLIPDSTLAEARGRLSSANRLRSSSEPALQRVRLPLLDDFVSNQRAVTRASFSAEGPSRQPLRRVPLNRRQRTLLPD